MVEIKKGLNWVAHDKRGSFWDQHIPIKNMGIGDAVDIEQSIVDEKGGKTHCSSWIASWALWRRARVSVRTIPTGLRIFRIE